MISMITSFLSKLRKGFSRLGEAGYTLTEMTAVVAISGALTAVLLPLAVEKISDGNATAAAGDMRTIGTAVADLFKDTGDFPMRSSSSNSFGTRFGKTLLLSTDTDRVTIKSPDISALVTGTATAHTTGAVVTEVGTVLNPDLFTPHFFTNAPCTGGSVSISGGVVVASAAITCPDATATTSLYSTAGEHQWNRAGYMKNAKLDPWGRSYVIYLFGIREAAAPSNTNQSTLKNLMILSAGPNGVINTAPSNLEPGGDDIAVIEAGKKS